MAHLTSRGALSVNLDTWVVREDQNTKDIQVVCRLSRYSVDRTITFSRRRR